MRRVSIAAIVILTVLFGVLYLLIESEKESNEFGNYEEMAESGLINLGWIPAFIPKSATLPGRRKPSGTSGVRR